ncbi:MULTISPECIES: S41 family peptidase [Sphingobacterium]|uniref:S41 family peptidase n=1 Tax=Sphingobacterium TaxID=28453 RepID=UPI0010E9E8E9|nr:MULTISPECIES: S41 family peptidase [Sphingobacterium]MCW2263168.1 carboxyl-terminal processing protease [Sphingobacterium kitahiroshimense]TCR11848.1 carboxyl-terminal processing protease [Sphingobacterium sp. JUb78]
MRATGLLLGIVCLSLSSQAQMNPKYKFEEALKLIQKNYVDQVNEEHLVDAAIKAMIADLDPHSRYTSREEAEAMREAMSGSFAGIGIQFLKSNDQTYVTIVNPDGPAMRAGIQVGDQIITIDGESISDKKWGNKEIMEMLRGEKDVPVELEILSPGNAKSKNIRIVRENILEKSVRESYMIDNEIGYIALSIFNRTTRPEIDEALKNLKEKGMKKLILDLQSNGGGYVESAIGVVDEFLTKEKIVFYSVPNEGGKDYYFTGGFGQFYDGELVVLIDESTASSSEIVTGALQDWDRAVIIGRRSFGKGLMQKPVPLSDGSEMQLTGARYYTPSGRSIQKSYTKGKDDYFQDFNRRMESKELLEEGHVQFPDSLKYTTLVSKRIVFGGGGIMPDRFVAIDTNEYSIWMSQLMNEGVVANVGFEFVQQNRQTLLKAYSDFSTFNKDFKVSNELHSQLVNMANKFSIELPKEKNMSAHDAIDVELKAQIASLLFTGGDYKTRVRNEANQSIKQALIVLQDKKLYKQLLSTDTVGEKLKQKTK